MPKATAMPKSAANHLNFKAQLVSRGPGGAWTYLQIPFSVPEVIGRKGQVPVRATINGFTFRNSLMPRAGVHILGVGKDILAAAATSPGDTVHVELALDDAPRTVSIPADLEAALAKSPRTSNPSPLSPIPTKRNTSTGSRAPKSLKPARAASRKWRKC